MRVEICTHEEAVEAVIRLFEQLAQQEGWQPGDQLRAHAERSVYFGVWAEGRLVGALQLISPDAAGEVPSHLVWPELPVIETGSQVLHAAALAVLPEYRRQETSAASWQLSSALWRYCVEHQVKTVWLEATPKMLRAYRLLGWSLVVIGELRQHWGEPCYPCSLSIREVAGSLAERALVSKTYRGILDYMLAPTTPEAA